MRVSGTEVTAYSLHPGVVHTELGRHMGFMDGWAMRFLMAIFWKHPEQGAQTTLHCALEERLGQESGLYYRYSC